MPGMDIIDPHPLRVWRQNHKVNLKTLGEEVGVGPSHISEIERRINGPSLDLTLRLSRLTGIAPKDIRPDLAELMDTAAPTKRSAA